MMRLSSRWVVLMSSFFIGRSAQYLVSSAAMSIPKMPIALSILLAAGCVSQPKEQPKKEKPSTPTTSAARPAMPGAIPAPPDVAAPPADAEKTKSGLASKVLQKGTGTEHPGETDIVTVNYTGWTTDGKKIGRASCRERA